MPIFVVDTLVSVRRRYVVEAKELEHAYDEITFRNSGNPRDSFEPLSTKDLGEVIMDGQEITNEQFELIFDSLEDSRDETHNTSFGRSIIRKINYDV